MQRPAKPCTSVRFRVAPPNECYIARPSPDGEIGRHKGLKIPRRKPYRFDSGSGHHLQFLAPTVIVLNLSCSAGHQFEAWFASVQAFETQSSSGLVECPHCNDTDISRLPSRLNIGRSADGVSRVPKDIDTVRKVMDALHHMSESSEDVGDRFPEEARRIHHREATPRNIKGQATVSEVKELLEEGVPVLPIPKKPINH